MNSCRNKDMNSMCEVWLLFYDVHYIGIKTFKHGDFRATNVNVTVAE